MLPFRHHPRADATPVHPWQTGHAAPEDRALGLELELIELTRQRRAIPRGSAAEQDLLDAEIDAVVAELGRISGEVTAPAWRVA